MKSVEKATKERFQKASAKPWKARFPSDEPTSYIAKLLGRILNSRLQTLNFK